MQYSLYCLTFANGKRYVGVAHNVRARMAAHRASRPRLVTNAIAEHGEPKLSILCVGDKEYIYDLEMKTIEEFNTTNPQFGYNVNIGKKHSAKSRTAISEACKGRTPWNRGKPRTSEERAAIKAALARSENFNPDRIAGWNKGVPHSAEAKAKMSDAHKGRPKSPEWRAKMSEIAYRRYHGDNST